KEELYLSNLSSGERQVIYIMLKAANTSKEETVLLMDEPEISLHLTWQEKLINSILYVNEKCQLIIVTHSPAIVMKGWMGAFVDIKNIQEETING
ncbi:ATP-binding protein, partial [Klebsiella pneumoniae]